MQEFFLEGELLKTHYMILRKFLVFKEKNCIEYNMNYSSISNGFMTLLCIIITCLKVITAYIIYIRIDLILQREKSQCAPPSVRICNPERGMYSPSPINTTFLIFYLFIYLFQLFLILYIIFIIYFFLFLLFYTNRIQNSTNNTVIVWISWIDSLDNANLWEGRIWAVTRETKLIIEIITIYLISYIQCVIVRG